MSIRDLPISRIPLVAKAHAIPDGSKAAEEVTEGLHQQFGDAFTRVDAGQLRALRETYTPPSAGKSPGTVKLIDVLLNSLEGRTVANPSSELGGSADLSREQILEILGRAFKDGRAAALAAADSAAGTAGGTVAAVASAYDYTRPVHTDRLQLESGSGSKHRGEFVFGGTRVLVSSEERSAFFDASTGQRVGEELPFLWNGFFAPNGEYAVARALRNGEYGEDVFVMNAKQSAPIAVPGKNGSFPAISPRGDTLFFFDEEKGGTLVDVATGDVIEESLLGFPSYSPNGDWLLLAHRFASDDGRGQISIVDPRDGVSVATLDASLGAAPGGFVLVGGGKGAVFANERALEHFDIATQTRKTLTAFAAKITDVALSEASDMVVVRTEDQRLFTVDPQGHVKELGDGGFHEPLLMDKGTTVLVQTGADADPRWSSGPEIRAAYDLTTGRLLSEISLPPNSHISRVSEDGGRAIVHDRSLGFVIYDTATGRPVSDKPISSSYGDVRRADGSVAECDEAFFAGEGRYVVTSPNLLNEPSEAPTPRWCDIYDAKDGSFVARLEGTDPLFSPDGSRILTKGPGCVFVHHFAPKV